MTLAQRLAAADGLVATRCGHRVQPHLTCRYEGADEPFLVCRACCRHCSPESGCDSVSITYSEQPA